MIFKGYDVKEDKESDVSSDSPFLETTDANEDCRIQICHEKQAEVNSCKTKGARFQWIHKILHSISKYKRYFS